MGRLRFRPLPSVPSASTSELNFSNFPERKRRKNRFLCCGCARCSAGDKLHEGLSRKPSFSTISARPNGPWDETVSDEDDDRGGGGGGGGSPGADPCLGRPGGAVSGISPCRRAIPSHQTPRRHPRDEPTMELPTGGDGQSPRRQPAASSFRYSWSIAGRCCGKNARGMLLGMAGAWQRGSSRTAAEERGGKRQLESLRA